MPSGASKNEAQRPEKPENDIPGTADGHPRSHGTACARSRRTVSRPSLIRFMADAPDDLVTSAEIPAKLLAVIEFLDHGRLSVLYQRLGFDVTTEWSVRKAVSLLRKLKPDVVIADFYFQTDFRDRLSNLESLLAATESLTRTRILVLYDPKDRTALDRVRQRMRVDAVLTIPVNEGELEAVLRQWLTPASANLQEAQRT